MTILSPKISKVVRSYLDRVGQNQPQVLGEQTVDFDPRDKTMLLSGFAAVRKSNSLSKLLAIAVLVVIFSLTVYLALLHRNDMKFLSFILGGNFLSLLVIVGWLRRVWLEGTTLDILSLLIQSMSPQEAVQVISTFYFTAIDKKT